MARPQVHQSSPAGLVDPAGGRLAFAVVGAAAQFPVPLQHLRFPLPIAMTLLWVDDIDV